MKLAYRDFLPGLSASDDGFGLGPLPTCLEAANDWLSAEEVEVINVETVVLPNILSGGERGAGDTMLHTGSEVDWYQFVRVWYREQ